MAARDPCLSLNIKLEAPHTAPGSIRKTCIAVEECLASNRDNLRGFFEKSFAHLLKRVFGYGDFDASWLNCVTKAGREADARALVDLLAPDGKLFAAMAQADNDRLVQYIFPTERLPAHTQELLKEPQGLGRRLLDTWPQYRGRIRQDAVGRPQVFLNVFEYFMFWTAFYVLRGSGSDGSRNDARAYSGSASSVYMGGLRGVGSALVGNLMMGRPAGTLQSHPYYRLLRTYLDYFLPRSAGGAAGTDASAASRAAPTASAAGGGGASASSGGCAGLGGIMGIGGLPYGFSLADGTAAAGGAGRASYKPSLTAAAGGPDSRGAVVLSILVEFWLTDVAEPLPSLAADRVSGVVQPGGGGGGGAGGGLGGVGQLGGGPASPGGMGQMGGASPTPVAVATPPSVRMLTYQPPSEELVEGLVVLVRYCYVVEPHTDGGARANGAAATAAGGAGGAAMSGGGMGARAGSGGLGAAAPGGGGRASVGGAGRGGPPGPVQPAQVGRPPWLPETPVKTPPPPPPRLLVPPTALVVHGNSASAAPQAVARKVYRQLRRAFSQWPASSPTSLTPLIPLWLSVIAPWCPPYAHTRKTVAASADAGLGSGPAGMGGGASGGAAGAGAGGHSAQVHHHMHALDGASALGAAAVGVAEATAAKLHLGGGGGRDRDRDVAGATSRELLSQYKYTPAWRSHVLAHLPFYLLLLPQFASLSLSRLQYRPDVALRDLDRVLAVLAAAGPELLRELRGAEAALNDYARPAAAGGRRRSEGEFGEVVPWWLEQAQDFEAAAAAGSSSPGAVQPDVAGRLFTIDAAGAAYSTCLLLRSAETLGRPELVAALRQSAGAVLPLGSILPSAVAEQPRGGDAAGGMDSSRFPRPGRWSQLHYKGDPLLRPIASNEVAWLVRPLVRLSCRLNNALGLRYREEAAGAGAGGGAAEEEEPPEHLGQQALQWIRRRGYRVNLRYLAELQVLAWLLVLALVLYGVAHIAWSGGGGGGGSGVTPGGGGAGSPAPPGTGHHHHQPHYHQQHYHHQQHGQQQRHGSAPQWQAPGVAYQQQQQREQHRQHARQQGEPYDEGQQAAQDGMGDAPLLEGGYTFGA